MPRLLWRVVSISMARATALLETSMANRCFRIATVQTEEQSGGKCAHDRHSNAIVPCSIADVGPAAGRLNQLISASREFGACYSDAGARSRAPVGCNGHRRKSAMRPEAIGCQAKDWPAVQHRTADRCECRPEADCGRPGSSPEASIVRLPKGGSSSHDGQHLPSALGKVHPRPPEIVLIYTHLFGKLAQIRRHRPSPKSKKPRQCLGLSLASPRGFEPLLPP